MSIIAALAPPTPTAARARRLAGPGQFYIDDTAPNAPAASLAPATVSLHSLLALQEAEADDVQDRAARRHAGSMLAELALIQRALLQADAAGMAASLSRLDGLTRDGVPAHDPRLAAVVRAIAMRAAIEAARHVA
ncbi:MAG: hypothetical protein NVSMB6_32020 [Burkholderiaceae bacterium]